MPSLVRPVAAIAATVAIVAPAAHAAPLKVGSPAPALKLSKWVKGAPVTKFAKGHVYVVEFWATWCGPCKTTIPHLTQMAKKLSGKATFIGVSISEGTDDYQAKVAKFVKDMGPKMDYSVAIDTAPRAGFMSTNWMDAAGQNGIPTAFVVDKDGKIAWIGHPMEMEEPLAQIIAGTFNPSAAAAKREAAEAAQRAIQGRIAAFQKALRTGDASVNKLAAELGESEMAKTEPGLLNFIAWSLIDPTSGPKNGDAGLALRLAQRAVELTQSKDGTILDTLALAQFKTGDVAGAIKTGELALKFLPELPAGADEATKKQLAEMRKEIADRLEMYKKQ